MSVYDDYKKKKFEIIAALNNFKKINGIDLFYELCFCILTPQSSGFRADECIQELKRLDFLNKNIDPKPILRKKIRFHNNKTKYIIEAKKNFSYINNELQKIKDPEEKRLFLVNNVKGISLKEASHYLRNIGYENLAILDRHILKNLVKHKAIKELPKTLTSKRYFQIEEKFKKFSVKVKIPMDHLDLLFWSEETGKVFK